MSAQDTPDETVESESRPLAPQDDAADSIVGVPELKTPPLIANDGEVILVVEAPWSAGNFDPSIDGCPVITPQGTAVPAQFADQAISIGASCGVTIVKR
jgi:hypothetical protein